jgi:hypothetical protein
MNNNDVNIMRNQSEYLDEQINFIGDFENLQEDFNSVCNQIGIPPYELPHYNQSKHKHWSEYYDKELLEFVKKKLDIVDIFSYTRM